MHLYNGQPPSAFSLRIDKIGNKMIDCAGLMQFQEKVKRKKSVPSPKKSKKSSKKARRDSSTSEEEQTSGSGDKVPEKDSSDKNSDQDEESEADSEDEVSNWGLLKVTHKKDLRTS